jgi:hypothetical protein
VTREITCRTVDAPSVSVYHAVTMPTARKANGQFKKSATARRPTRRRNPAAKSAASTQKVIWRAAIHVYNDRLREWSMVPADRERLIRDNVGIRAKVRAAESDGRQRDFTWKGKKYLVMPIQDVSGWPTRHRNPAASSDTIVVTARFIDGGGERKTFKTLEGARKYAQSRIGAHPSIGGGYAVDNSGVCTIRVTGTSLQSLFPARGAKLMRRGTHRHECMSPGCDREGRHLAYEGSPEGDLYYCDDCAYQHSYGRVGSPDSSLMPYPEDIGGHDLFCQETSSGWEMDAKGNMVYDCHCGGRFAGER